MRFFGIFFLVLVFCGVGYCDDGWYVEGNFRPAVRLKVVLENKLDVDRAGCGVVIKREDFPVKDVHELWVTVVDPAGESREKPTKEQLAKYGSHMIRKESNGRALYRQLDDIDKDGVWDELFFMVDMEAGEKKEIYIYGGFSQRGWNEHGTHAAIGSYCRHLVPFWEAENVGWKLWYPTDCDMYGKRKSMLMSQHLYMENLDGYSVPFEMGSDIMQVAKSFGAGGICLFESACEPNRVSRPRFTGRKSENLWGRSRGSFNAGPVGDTRYSYDVVVNGPLRSMIRVRTMGWDTGAGEYGLEQLFTVYKGKSYYTCKVKFDEFEPANKGVAFGCGIRKNGRENEFYQQGGVVITVGDDELADPDDEEGLKKVYVDYVGCGLVVKSEYRPEYRFIESGMGNHVFSVPVNSSREFEYMVAGGWSEGAVLKEQSEFVDYVIEAAKEYESPLAVCMMGVEERECGDERIVEDEEE